MNNEAVKELVSQIESQGKDSDQIMTEITKEYTEQLDNTVEKIQVKLAEAEGDLPIDDLIQYVTELCPIVFFTLAGLERLGNRADIIEQLRLEKYNLARQTAQGTAADKTSFAENKTLDETLVSSIYSRAYKAVKMRTDAAQMLIDSLKKALSAKMSEMQLMRSQNSVMSN